jgi:hypothetical protein
VKLNVDIIFDGIPDGKGLKSAFGEAVKLVKNKQYKSTPQDRAKMLDLRRFSDFLSGGAGGKQFDPAIKGLFGEPKNLSRYQSEESAPDTEVGYEDIKILFGEEIAEQFEFDTTTTDRNKRTIEIKQKLKEGGTTTFTQLGSGLTRGSKEFAGSINAIRSQATIKETVDKKNRIKIKAELYDQEKLFKWFESPAQTKYRNALITQFNQKMQNYLLFTYTDGKLKISAVPGLAKKFDLSTAQRRRKLTTLEFRGGATGGSISLRTSKAGNALLKENMKDVTQRVVARAEEKFLENILKFYVRGAGSDVLRRNGAKTKYGLINAFAELLVIAQEFERNPLEIEFKSGPMQSGRVISKAKSSAKRKRQTKDPIQHQITVQQIEALARKLFRSKMPKGVPGGPPPPINEILTERTGRFAQSFTITKFNKSKEFIEYTYDPIYNVFESERRAPSKLIEEQGLRPAVQQLIGKYHRFIRK